MQYQHGFHLPIRLRIGPSSILNRIVFSFHALGVSPLLYADLKGWIIVSAGLVLCLHYRWLRMHKLNNSIQLIMKSRHDWLLSIGDDQFSPVKILPGSFVHPYMTILRFRKQQKIITVILTGDNVDTDQFRRLRVFLRFPPPE